MIMKKIPLITVTVILVFNVFIVTIKIYDEMTKDYALAYAKN